MSSIWEISEPIFEADAINNKLRIAPWEGHRLFAYDLIKFLEVGTFVELGTHYGSSFFAVCQSIKDFKLQTKCYAIDTWVGDEQAGYYDDEVINTVRKTIDLYFKDLNIHLLRKTFDEALEDFDNNSIDLIHIDGLHTYEAVSNDFTTWLPKLKENGLILFHDVYSKLGYGSDIFWNEVKQNYPYFEFDHSWGLGILFPKGKEIYMKLLAQNIHDKMLLYKFKSLFQFEQIRTNDLGKMVFDRDKNIQSNVKMIQDKDKVLLENEKIIADRELTIIETEKMIQDKDLLILNNEKMIQDKDLLILKNEKMIQERDLLILVNEKMVQGRDAAILNNEKMIQDRDLAILSNIKMIDERNDLIKRLEAEIELLNERNKGFFSVLTKILTKGRRGRDK